jgi:AcrR family transcriptional regulator
MGVKTDAGTSLRVAQAAQTRVRVLDAASRVFEARGFAGTRIEDIAAQAGVAVPTVYKVFVNKRNLLIAAVRRAMAGSDDDRGLEQQAWFAEQMNERDPARQLTLIARNARRLYERAGRLLDVLQAAAPLDPDLASERDRVMKERLTRSRQTARSLIGKAPRRVRLSREEVVVSLASLTAPELFAAHRAAGRDAAAYEKWLADVLRRTVLNG